MAQNLLDVARQYHGWGANVNAIGRGSKKPIHPWKELHTRRQDYEELTAYHWSNAGGVGVNNGPGGWHTFDIDAIKNEGEPPIVVCDATIDALLTALGLPIDYPWVWRGQSQAGWALAFQCDEPMPPGVLPAKNDEAGVAWGWPAKDSGADWHHIELRYSNSQTVYPPTTRYMWRGEAPEMPPWPVPIHRVISAFFALCPPAPHTLGSVDRAVIDQIRHNFDMVSYAESVIGGELQNESSGEVRLLGHGGLLINPDKGIWNAFGDEIGGDCFDMVAYASYRTTARNLNGKSAQVLKDAAAWAGVTLPERKPENVLTTPSTPRRDDVPAFRLEIATEDELMDLPPLQFLDRDLGIIAGGYHLIYGASGSGKTFFAIERAMRQATQGRRVLYIPTEDLQGLRYRVAAWRRAHPEAIGRLTWLKMPDGLDLQNPNHVAALLDTINPYQYDLVVIDTLRESHTGDENSSQDTARLNRAIQRIVTSGAAVDVVHHSGVAGERPRGSTALFGNADVVMKVENEAGIIRINYDKLRNAPPRDPLGFGLVSQDSGMLDADGEPVISAIVRPEAQISRRNETLPPNYRRILQTLALSIFAETGAKSAQVTASSELPMRTVFNGLSWLKDRGFISQGMKGDPYTITHAGRVLLGLPTASNDSAPESPTESTASSLKATESGSSATPNATAATATTLRGGSAGSEVTVTEAFITQEASLARMARAGSRRLELVDRYEELYGELTQTLTIEQLEEAIAAAVQQ